MDVPPTPDPLLNEIHEFDELHIHRGGFIRMMATEKMVELVQRRLIVAPALGSVCHRYAFLRL
jgi:hypothetical protein